MNNININKQISEKLLKSIISDLVKNSACFRYYYIHYWSEILKLKQIRSIIDE